MRRLGKKKINIDMEKAEDEDWDNYRRRLDEEIKKRLKGEENAYKQNIDHLWDIIEKSIRVAALATLPIKKKIPEEMTVKEEEVETQKLRLDIKELGKWCRKLKKKEERSLTEEEKTNLKRITGRIKAKWKIEAEDWEVDQDLNRENLEMWWKVLRKDWQARTRTEEEKRIQEYIERRFEMIVKDQRKMIDSLLDKPHRSIKLDRVVKKTEDNNKDDELVTEPQEVLAEVKKHFKKQF
jgi:hypothetical protein